MVSDKTTFESTDPAYLQMMRSLESIPNIDINPKNDPEATGTEKDNSDGGDNRKPSVVVKAGTPKPVSKKTAVAGSSKAAKRVKMTDDGTSGDSTLIRFSVAGRARINLARMLYGQMIGRAVSSEEFIMLNIEKGFKKLSPEAYELWKLMASAPEGNSQEESD